MIKTGENYLIMSFIIYCYIFLEVSICERKEQKLDKYE
jgi:hypothetical protein